MRRLIFITVILCFIYTKILGISNFILGDGVGYYSYLPSIFIYHDFNLSYFHPQYFICIVEPSGIINKYTMGTSVLMSPFFFFAHFLTILKKGIANGLSYYYNLFIMFGTLFYWSFGIYFTYKILIAKINKKIAIFTCALITYGTGIINYMTYEPSYSHIYSFFAISLFLYLVVYKKSDFLIGIMLGLIFMIRNMNVLVIIFYIINTKPKKFLMMLCGFFIAIAPQIYYWYHQTGHLIINSYGHRTMSCYLNNFNCIDERFNWFKPKFLHVLFSMKHGLFVYYPILIFSFLGIKSTKKYFNKIFWPAVIFIATTTYMIASWHMWWLGTSFGERIYVDYMCIFAIFLGSFLQDKKNEKIYPLFIFIMLLFVFVSLCLMYLHWSVIYKI